MNESLISDILAVVTIVGNDDESGIFSFHPMSLQVEVEESEIGLWFTE